MTRPIGAKLPKSTRWRALGVTVYVLTVPIWLTWVGLVETESSVTPWVVVNFATWPLGLVLAITLHELGHAATGAMLGGKVWRVQVGTGAKVFERRIGTVWFALHALPISGVAYTFPLGRAWRRLRAWLVIAAGPLVNAAVLWLLFRVVPVASFGYLVLPVEGITTRFVGVELFATANLLLLIVTLFPAARMQTDGKQLLRIPFLKDAVLDELVHVPAVLETYEAVQRRDYDEAERMLTRLSEGGSPRNARHLRAYLHLARQEYDLARDVYVALLTDGGEPPQHQWLLKNNIAWTNFLLRDPDLLDEADAYSKAVLANVPGEAYAHGTRGAVLWWRGEAVQACEHMLTAFFANTDPQLRALNACTLALAHAENGDLPTAREWLDRARADDPHCALLAEATAASQ